MEIRCTFGEYTADGERFYICLVKDQQIPENQELNFIGQHQGGKSNNFVTYVEFGDCTITKVPQGLTKIFPNMKVLDIWRSKLKKICKNDLVEYKNLTQFRCEYNEIEFLPGNLFDDFKDLEAISFYENKLKVIKPNILDGLVKLKNVDFRANPNYGKCFSIYPRSSPNATLEEVKEELRLRYEQNSELHAKYLQQENPKTPFKLQRRMFDDLKVFFDQDETYKDFRIQIDDREFPVHKLMLAARSPTLAEILKNNPEVENLNLVDISVEIFEIILKFLYTDELPGDDGTNFLHLFAAAGKLKIEELMEFAAVKIINTINEKNALDILKLSNKYDYEEMRIRAFAVVKKMYPNVNFKDEFAADLEKIDRFMEAIKRKEEIEREIEKMLNN